MHIIEVVLNPVLGYLTSRKVYLQPKSNTLEPASQDLLENFRIFTNIYVGACLEWNSAGK